MFRHVIIGLSLALLTATSVNAAEVELGDAEKGAKVFTTYCAICHGATGKGDGVAGKSLTPKPRDFTDATRMKTINNARLISVISKGGAANGLSPLMVAWGAILKPADVKNVAAFVRSLAPKVKP